MEYITKLLTEFVHFFLKGTQGFVHEKYILYSAAITPSQKLSIKRLERLKCHLRQIPRMSRRKSVISY